MKMTMALLTPAKSAVWLVGLAMVALVAFGIMGPVATAERPADSAKVLVDAKLAL